MQQMTHRDRPIREPSPGLHCEAMSKDELFELANFPKDATVGLKLGTTHSASTGYPGHGFYQ